MYWNIEDYADTGRERAMLSENTQTEQAEALMRAFASRTGLDDGHPVRRYLWTDAFAVCNLLGLAAETGREEYAVLALRLIDQVHETLGRFRPDDARTGWISGMGEDEGRARPTAAGLRIGKPLPERGEGEPYDGRLEWKRDGQYFHYLAKWMHALDSASRRTGDPRYAGWACELVSAAGKAFVYVSSSGHMGMYWKMSVDLSRPLVESMGQHDPLDGYLTAHQLLETSGKMPVTSREDDVGGCAGIGEWAGLYAEMVRGRAWGTTDVLGLGGLLSSATHLAQLIGRGASPHRDLLLELLHAAEYGIYRWNRSGILEHQAEDRLAFRELGLAIGLESVRWMREAAEEKGEYLVEGNDFEDNLKSLDGYVPLGRRIISFWLEPENRSTANWLEHEDINSVMLATALAPGGFMLLPGLETAAAGLRGGGGQ